MDADGATVFRTGRAAGSVRRAFAVTAVLASTLLVLTSWRSRQTSLALAVTITHGQAESLRNDLASRWPPQRGPASVAALQATLAADREEGLRALALIDAEGHVVRVVGDLSPCGFPSQAGTDPQRLQLVGGRVRMILPPTHDRPGPPPREPSMAPPPPDGDFPGGGFPGGGFPGGGFPGGGFPGGGFPGGGPSGGPPPDMAPPWRMVIEFEPGNARVLERQADQVLLAASAIAALLLAAAAWLWRMSLRAEEADRRAALRDRLAALGTMSAVIAHEIRNPLASLKGNAQLLVERLADGSRERAQADRVVTAAGRLERLTRDLVSFVGDGPPSLARTDPVEVVRAVLADSPGAVTVEVEGTVSDCHLDAGQVRMALGNLVDNALRASPEGVSVVVRMQDGEVQYRVRDRGRGIPADDLERIFEPFVTGRAQGAGLGLAIVRRVAARHGGSAWARNLPGGGAEFGLRLPARPDGE